MIPRYECIQIIFWEVVRLLNASRVLKKKEVLKPFKVFRFAGILGNHIIFRSVLPGYQRVSLGNR